MKKTIILVLILILLVSTVKANILYTDQTEYEQDKDDTFTVTLYVNLTIDSYGIFLYELNWNPEIIELQTVNNTTEWEMKYSGQGGIEPGKISYVNWWKMGHNETGVIPILELTYKAIKDGNSELQFSKINGIYSHTFDKEANIYELECINATVTIKDSSNNGNGGNGNNGGNGGHSPPPPPPPPVNKDPIAIIDQPTEQYVNTTVNFTANQSYDQDGTITTYQWDFGDDQTANGITVNHTYTRPDVYTVLLTVSDNNDATDSTTSHITILEQPIQNNTEPPTNQTDQPENNTEPIPNNQTNITKPDDGLDLTIQIIILVATLVCIIFIVYWYKWGELE